MKAKQFFCFVYVFTSVLFFTITAVSAELVNDFSRLNPVEVQRVVRIHTPEDIIQGLQHARQNNLRVSISAKRHSHGGHTANRGGVVLNTSEYNQVIAFDPQAQTITVESGATWGDIQAHINASGLAVKVMQSSNIFSIGGSISTNIHGRDPRFGTIAETVLAFAMILADGTQITASREENPDLFYSVLGGYGLLGVITQVEIRLTTNNWLEKQVTAVSSKEYVPHLEKRLNAGLALHYGRCSIVQGDDFLRECVAVDYIQQPEIATDIPLSQEKNIGRNKFFFDLSRSYHWAKSLRWWLQELLIDKPGATKRISRNNAMRPPIQFLEHFSATDTDILQEYFVPKNTAFDFLEDLRAILLENDVNLLSMTLRYVPKSENVYLNYAQQDVVALVLYMNISMHKQELQKVAAWTRNIVTAANKYGGVYYLPYQGFPTKAQFRTSYPGWEQFTQVKQKYDPEQLFSSEFYKQYFLE